MMEPTIAIRLTVLDAFFGAIVQALDEHSPQYSSQELLRDVETLLPTKLQSLPNDVAGQVESLLAALQGLVSPHC